MSSFLSQIDGGVKGFAAVTCGVGALMYATTLDDRTAMWSIFAAVVMPVVVQGIWRWNKNRQYWRGVGISSGFIK